MEQEGRGSRPSPEGLSMQDGLKRIESDLGILSVFPVHTQVSFSTTVEEGVQLTARCMHEKKDDIRDSTSDFVEDVIVKVRRVSVSGTHEKQVWLHL